MIPYGDFYFFYILALILIPVVFLGLLQKPIKHYSFIINILMIIFIFESSKLQMQFLAYFYIMELTIIKLYVKIRKKYNKLWIFWTFLVISMLPLVFSKFSGIIMYKQLGFLGISYVTFKIIQILIEINDGLIEDISIYDATYFILFFPTISSGPIDRSRRFQADINRVLPRREYLEYLGDGLNKIMHGILYKFVIAYFIHNYWISQIPTKQHTFTTTIQYMYAYSFYLFFDFAGYSLIAVGVSCILGVKTPDNFKLPFISRDMKDFWNRWHMSLSFWFRDFIYTRFVMKAIKKKWFKSRYTSSYIGYMITMGLMGIWHGIEIHYIVYGIYQAVLIILTDMYQRKSWYKKLRNNIWYKGISTVITFNLICFGFLIFSGYLFK